jgi:hypothetical protein
VTALARPISNCTVNYRPVLSSERAPHSKKPATYFNMLTILTTWKNLHTTTLGVLDLSVHIALEED